MTRWATQRTYFSVDREQLHQITIYPVGDNKERVKADNKDFNYTRLLLLREKGNIDPEYMIQRISKAGNGKGCSV